MQPPTPEIGHSQRRPVLLIYLWAAVLAFGAIALALFDVFVIAWGISGLLFPSWASRSPACMTYVGPDDQFTVRPKGSVQGVPAV